MSFGEEKKADTIKRESIYDHFTEPSGKKKFWGLLQKYVIP